MIINKRYIDLNFLCSFRFISKHYNVPKCGMGTIGETHSSKRDLPPERIRPMYLRLTETERAELQQLATEARCFRIIRRARALLELDAGASPQFVAKRYNVARSTIYNWIRRCRHHGFTVESLRDLPRSGRPRAVFPRDAGFKK